MSALTPELFNEIAEAMRSAGVYRRYDYELARALCVHRNMIARYRNGTVLVEGIRARLMMQWLDSYKAGDKEAMKIITDILSAEHDNG